MAVALLPVAEQVEFIGQLIDCGVHHRQGGRRLIHGQGFGPSDAC